MFVQHFNLAAVHTTVNFRHRVLLISNIEIPNTVLSAIIWCAYVLQISGLALVGSHQIKDLALKLGVFRVEAYPKLYVQLDAAQPDQNNWKVLS